MIGTCVATFRAEWVTSLKEKRMIRRSLMEKTRNKFNVSIAEVDTQDDHNLLTIGFAIMINFLMFFQLKKIDMVESLKSTE